MWAPLKRCCESSTRAELAALVLAMHMDVPMHIGIDNKPVVDKATELITIDKRAEEKRQ